MMLTMTVGKPFTVFVLAVPLSWLSPVPLWLTLCLTLAGQIPKQLCITSKLADVIRAGAPADLLTSAPSQSQEVSRIYEDYDALKDFVSAFPVSYSPSFKRALPP